MNTDPTPAMPTAPAPAPPAVASEPPAAPPPVIALGENGDDNIYWSMPCRRLYRLRISEHTGRHLRRMASPADYAAWLYPGADAEWVAENEGGILREAANALVDATRAAGTFDASSERLRACGVWHDAAEPGALVYNAGQACYLMRPGVAGGAPTLQRVPGQRGEHIYTSGAQSLPTPARKPLSDEEGETLLGFLTARLWEAPWQGELLAGWLVCAVLAGALPFRPQVWVNAPAETGKTTLRDDLEEILGALAISLSGAASTPAGLRQKLQGSALPVLFDEAEAGGGARALGNLEGLLELIRAAATGKNARICKGGPDGEHRDYALRNCFILFSINNILHREADTSRFLQLRMRRLPTAKQNEERWRAQEPGRRLIAAADFTPRLLTRLLKGAPDTLANIAALKAYLRSAGVAARASELFAALMAGAHALCHAGPMDEGAMQHALVALRLYEKGIEATMDDCLRCLSALCGYTLPWEGSRASVAQLCEIIATADAGAEEHTRAATALGSLGLRWRGELDALQVNPAARALREAYRDSDWPMGNITSVLTAECTGMGQSKANLYGIWTSSARVNGVPQRCIFVPYQLIASL